MSHFPAPGWYGKLPGSGDFMRRRLPPGLIDSWSRWFQNGIERMRTTEGPDKGTSPQFIKAPLWNFIIPASLGVPVIQMGCLLPARDRVGRQYPVCVMQLYLLEEWHSLRLRMAGDWYYQLGKTLSMAVQNRYSGDQFDRALAGMPPIPEPDSGLRSDVLDIIGYQDVPCHLNWPQVESYFDPLQYSSFWWTNQSDGSAFYTHSHSGNFTTRLFFRLFNPPHARRGDHNGLHPPLFNQS